MVRCRTSNSGSATEQPNIGPGTAGCLADGGAVVASGSIPATQEQTATSASAALSNYIWRYVGD